MTAAARSPEGSPGRWSACWWSAPASRGSRSPTRWRTPVWTAWCSRRAAGSAVGCTPWTWRVAGGPRRLLDAPPVGQPAAPLRRDAGLECRPGDPLPTLSGVRLRHRAVAVARGRRGDPDRRPRGLHRRRSTALRARLGPTASAADGIEAFLATTGLAGDVASTSPARPPGECRGGRGRSGRAPVAGVAVDPGRVRRRLLRRPALRAGTPRLWTRWLPGSTCAWTGRWHAST